MSRLSSQSTAPEKTESNTASAEDSPLMTIIRIGAAISTPRATPPSDFLSPGASAPTALNGAPQFLKRPRKVSTKASGSIRASVMAQRSTPDSAR